MTKLIMDPTFLSSESNAKYCPKIECRWKSYGIYRGLLWAWMTGELVMTSGVEIAHKGHVFLNQIFHAIGIIFIGLPLLYSEICITQYTNCNIFALWNFFPLFRCFGIGSIVSVIFKTIYLVVLSSWFLVYTFYASYSPPPWYCCDYCDTPNCLVKRLNVSIFQHCLEMQLILDEECGLKTASGCFFDELISNNNTNIWPMCLVHWKLTSASALICFVIYMLCIKRERHIQLVVKFEIIWCSIILFFLLCVSITSKGSWFNIEMGFVSGTLTKFSCFELILKGFLGVGTGYGIVVFLTMDVPFRSAAMMTSVVVSSYSMLVCAVFSSIIFSGIKTMSYYHGGEPNIIEYPDNYFYFEFASVSEILNYYKVRGIMSFLWFASVFLILFVNLSVSVNYILSLVNDYSFFYRNHHNICSLLIISIIWVCSFPFQCTDLTPALTDILEFTQLFNNLFFSIALYWVYNFKNHIKDIIFMIGIKASYFWKTAWVLNPLFIVGLIYVKLYSFAIDKRTDIPDSEHDATVLPIRYDWYAFYSLAGIYSSFIILALLADIVAYIRYSSVLTIFFPSPNWGPQDNVLFKSRKMFVPEIMTREFLYRQVRIYRYCKLWNNRKDKYFNKEPQPDNVSLSNGN